MNLSYLVSLPEWFNPWGWVGIGVIIVILLVILITLIVKSFKKGEAAEEEEGEPEYADEEVGEEQKPQPVASKAEPETTIQPEEDEQPEEPAKSQTPSAGKKAVKEEKSQKAETPVKSEKTESAPAPQAADESAPEEAPKAPRTPVKTYHISKRKDDNKWQVKAAGGAKAIKLFFTQADAIEFAKKLAESQEARIVIHKEDGSFRRLNYKKQ